MREGRDDDPGLRRLPAVKRDLAAAVAIVTVVVGAAAFRPAWRAIAPRPSADACAALVDRYLVDKSRARFPELGETELERITRSSEASDRRPHDVASCRKELTASQVTCGLDAPDVEALERCMR